MGSRRTSLRRRIASALGVWAVAFCMLSFVAALPEGLEVHLAASPQSPLVGQLVTFNATVHRNHEDTSCPHWIYRFDFGDGTGTDWQTSANSTHAYAATGNYTATVVVKDNHDHRGSASVRIHVLPPLPPSPDVRPVLGIVVPARPSVGAAVNLTVVLYNAGAAAALSATVRVTDSRPDGTATPLGHVALATPLPPADIVSVVFGPFQAAVVGNHTLQVRVTDVSPAETNAAPRVLNLTMTVMAAPPPPERTGPQLRLLAALLDPTQPAAGDSVNLSVVLWNNGTAAAEAATFEGYDLRPNGTTVLLDSVALPAPLPPSTGRIIPFPSFVAAVPGTHTLRILATNVSPAPLKPETSEVDVRMLVLGVTPPPPADHGGAAFDFGPLAIGLAAVGVASAAAAAYVFLRPQPSTALEPPPPAPPDLSPPPLWPP